MKQFYLSALLSLACGITQCVEMTEGAEQVAEQPQKQATQQNKEQLARAEANIARIADLANKQLMAADYLAQSLQSDIMNNKIENREILPILKDIRGYLQEYMYKEARTPNEFIRRVELTAAMTRHMHDGILSHFKNWGYFQVPNFSRADDKLGMDELLAYIERLSVESLNLIEDASQEIPFVGVGPFRRALRKTTDFLSRHTPPKAYVLGAVGLSAVSLWILFNIQKQDIGNLEEKFDKTHLSKITHVLSWLKTKVGSPALSGPHGEPMLTATGQKVGEEIGLLTPIHNVMLAVGLIPKDNRPYDVLTKLSAFFALQAAGTYVTEQLKLRYNNVHQYLFGRSHNDNAATVITTEHNGFEEIIGNESAKDTCEDFIEYIISPEKLDRIDGSPGFAILFTGETRVGKTFFAKHIAGEINQRFKARGLAKEVRLIEIKAAYAEAYQAYFGSICGAIRFYIEQHAPCIVFIDEIHLLGLNKDKDPKMLSDFLTLLSGVEKMNTSHPCLIIAATNHPELLDKALLQKGRFGTQIELTYPHAIEREEFIRRRLDLSGIKTDDQFIAEFVIKTQGLSFEQIEDIIRQQKRQALIYQKPITPESLDDAFNRSVYEIQEDAHPLPENEARLVSINVASKLVAHHLMDQTAATQAQDKRIIARATVLPATRRIKMHGEQGVDLKTIKQYGAVFSYKLNEPNGILNEADLRHEAIMMLAGHAGEELVLNSRALHAQEFDPDMYHAYELCLKIVSRGMKIEMVAKDRQNKLREEAFELLLNFERQAKELLANHVKEIEMVANMLDHVKIANQQLIDVMFYIIDNPEEVQQQLKELEEQFAQQDSAQAQVAG